METVLFLTYFMLLVTRMKVVAFHMQCTPSPMTHPTLELDKYSGRWFQAYASLIPNTTFEKDGYCITADYHIIDDTKLGFVHSQNMNSPQGIVMQETGNLEVVSEQCPGQMCMTVADTSNTQWCSHSCIPFGNYWILNLGEVDPISLMYSWAGKL